MATQLGQPNFISILFFLIFVILTLLITYWAAKKTKTSSEFYAAGRSITGFQNGLALSGDFMSAASFLGISGMVALKGFDGTIYAVGWLVGWPALLFLIAEPLRNLGKFTFADVVAFRLKQKPIRISASIGGILVTLTYSTAQIVGSGKLINLMFGIPYEGAVVLVGFVMLLYVLFGGMIATTWVQIIKACLLLFGVTLLALLALSRFGFDPENLYGAVEKEFGRAALEPGGLTANPVDSVSLGLALMLGLLGLPHILMRFYTVPDAKEARKSVAYATTFIGYFYLIIPIVGFAAAALVGRTSIAAVDQGGNMAATLLAELLGGNALMGFIAAVAFATILAVVAGLTLAAASTISHDLYVNVFKNGEADEKEQVLIAKKATIAFGVLSILIGILFKHQNVAFLVGLAFAVAASGNFPALFLSILWRNLSTAGAVLSILVGSVSAVVLIVFSPTVWVEVFGFKEALFALKNPAIVSMPLSFVTAFVFSKVYPEKTAREKYDSEKIRTYLGIGAE
ncbi:cation/acetate symporter ActP [Leptospira gomenensis]|uniref:Cation/acetate symporter ActP n=1 Tax=Leptospira gomenensis TaxID=2484974 RepID=A0A5F1YE02_9LEPT|nr:sodium/solute symporter [Leptospira gomenensis]TGK33796.1 cation/acetate symporter ActP [Leptospira gomenensis]TGK36365.1 cation/acetate symporter ActP [Leptospira gomenensis]TGK47389.1 cation/acetate symporter ActP [Leptospira gomenensis]TGK60662.1 cation/acetate symporter ActP [Leptospira gomenensis]